MVKYDFWHVSGTYYEVCNCEAVCPCRRHGAHNGGRSTSGICDFALSWRITEGCADDIDLANLAVVLAGSYSDDEPGSPWRVIIYVDEQGDARQRQALADIFLGRAGGGTRKNFAAVIGEVYAVRYAQIRLVHTPQQERMEVTGFLSAATERAVATDLAVSCGIPGHDRPGQEIIADHFQVEDENLKWAVNGRCGFATDFSYLSSSM
jgi:hypothetical protein